MRSGLYTGRVVHERLRPKRHRLAYRVFCLLVDLDELDEIDRRFGRLLAVNRPGLFSFEERDHGAGTGSLRDWATAQLAAAGIGFDGGRIELLCYPRLLGFTFNPLSVYFCYRRSGELAGLLYEVHNTHGERHTYVMPAGAGAVVRHAAKKTFFVSPFMPMDCTYRFRIAPPADRVGISILEDDADGLLLTASFTDTGDAAFALHPNTGDLYLRILRGLDGLDYEEFEDIVHSIAKTADHWDNKLGEL